LNTLLWIAQLILAAIFLFVAGGKLFAYQRVVTVVEKRKGHAVTMTHGQAVVVAMAEIAGAVGVLMPIDIAPSHAVVLVSAAWLALIMVCAGIYHALRREYAAPNVALFLLALFVIVGRWPRFVR
jgi:hypothetical protein